MCLDFVVTAPKFGLCSGDVTFKITRRSISAVLFKETRFEFAFMPVRPFHWNLKYWVILLVMWFHTTCYITSYHFSYDVISYLLSWPHISCHDVLCLFMMSYLLLMIWLFILLVISLVTWRHMTFDVVSPRWLSEWHLCHFESWCLCPNLSSESFSTKQILWNNLGTCSCHEAKQLDTFH